MNTLFRSYFILCVAGTTFAQSPSSSSDESSGNTSTDRDVVLEWNAALSDHFDEFSLGTTAHIQARVYAMVHVAMRDAVVAAMRELRVDPDDARVNLAAGTAAHVVTTALCPAGGKRFTSLHGRHIAAFATVRIGSEGQTIGQRIAASVLDHRAKDGWPIALAESKATASGTGRRKRGQPTPFILKRVQEFRPEPPFYEFPDGVIRPNRKLQNNKTIGSPADVDLTTRVAAAWSIEPVLLWNRATWSHAVQYSQTLLARVRLFAALNTALADALLSATYWADMYREDRGDATIRGALHEYQSAIADGNMLPEPSILAWATKALNGFPPTSAVLAGAADSILRSSFDESVFVDMRLLVRRCAWSALVHGGSTIEGCVAGYELGNRIGGRVQKQAP